MLKLSIDHTKQWPQLHLRLQPFHKKAKLSLRAAELEEESVRYNLRLNVIAAYMDVLCAKEEVSIAEQAASLIEAKLDRSAKLMSAGSITESDVLQLRAQFFATQNDVASAKHAEQMARLSLCDLLEIEDYTSFQIAEPVGEEVLPLPFDYEASIENHPDYRLSTFNETIALANLKMAKSALYPKLSFSAGYGSSFSDARKKTIVAPDGTIQYEAYPFLQQYADNASAYVSVGLQIPILNGLTARNAVKRARIAATEAEYATIASRKQLRRKILQAQIDCDAARDQHQRALEEERYAEHAFRQIDEKYNLGVTDYLTWSTAAAELAKARYLMVETKYRSILTAYILKSYYL